MSKETYAYMLINLRPLHCLYVQLLTALTLIILHTPVCHRINTHLHTSDRCDITQFPHFTFRWRYTSLFVWQISLSCVPLGGRDVHTKSCQSLLINVMPTRQEPGCVLEQRQEQICPFLSWASAQMLIRIHLP